MTRDCTATVISGRLLTSEVRVQFQGDPVALTAALFPRHFASSSASYHFANAPQSPVVRSW